MLSACIRCHLYDLASFESFLAHGKQVNGYQYYKNSKPSILVIALLVFFTAVAVVLRVPHTFLNFAIAPLGLCLFIISTSLTAVVKTTNTYMI